jgi:hypothetical protein
LTFRSSISDSREWFSEHESLDEENEDSNMLERRKIFSIHLILKKKMETSPLSMLDTKAWDSHDNKSRDTHVS